MKSHHSISMQSNWNLTHKLRENNPILQISRRRTKKQHPAYQTNMKCLESNSEAGARLDSSSTILFYPAFENIAEPTSTQNTLSPKVPGGIFVNFNNWVDIFNCSSSLRVIGMLSVLVVLIEVPIWEVGNGFPLSLGFLVSAVHQCVVQKNPIYKSVSQVFKNQKFNCNYNFKNKPL